MNKHLSKPVFAFSSVSGIFPDAPDTETLWENILNARISRLTPLEKRWGISKDIYFDPRPGKADKIYLDRGFCLPENKDDVKACQIETGTKVVHDLIHPETLKASPPDLFQTGLIIAACGTDQDYFNLDLEFTIQKKKFPRDQTLPIYSADEQLKIIAEKNNLKGPGIAIDTACASSLYAVDMAMKMMEAGRARAMVILGLNLSLSPVLMAVLSQIMVLSPTGESLPFAENRSGMVPGEAAGAVLLEPLDTAKTAGRNIFGVIKSVGLSSDGSEGSAFSPGGNAQILAYERAYGKIDPGSIDYIETHGTATDSGDDAEIYSLSTFFDQYITGRKIPLGSVKSLIGHSLAAAGMSSLIKSLLILKHRIIPPHIPVPPHPQLLKTCLSLPEKAFFMEGEKKITIGVSAFGLGGSNAHMVIESYFEQSGSSSVGITGEKTLHSRTPIAILDMETAIGPYIGLQELATLDNTDFPVLTPFPDSRFSMDAGSEFNGLFFPEDLKIDTAGFRMGPNLLKGVDPFQNLLSFLVKRIFDRYLQFENLENTGIVICNNLGGGKPAAFSRKYFIKNQIKTDHIHPPDNYCADTTIEEITSSMASMSSGFPAYHFNIRGFHLTISGGEDTFFQTLLSTPAWLQENCTSIIVGAGHYISSPIHFVSKPFRDLGKRAVAEGAGVFLLKDLCVAQKNNDDILAVITDMIPAREANNFDSACSMSNILKKDITIREKCHLDKYSFKDSDQIKGWYMGEATGIESFLSVLLKPGKYAAIEVFKENNLWITIFIEKKKRFHRENTQFKLPVTIRFKDPCIQELTEKPQKKGAPLLESATGHHGQNSLIFSNPGQLLDWQKRVSKIVQKYFFIQKGLISLLAQGDKSCSSKSGDIGSSFKPDRKPENIVITSVSHTNDGTFSADLVLDRNHPYFFDHPLDHVPGILMTEGALQVFEIASSFHLHHRLISRLFILNFDVTYKKWCELDSPVILKLIWHKDLQNPSATVLLTQNEKLVAVVEIKVGFSSMSFVKKKEITGISASRPENAREEYLHKKRSENVMVSDIDLDNDDYRIHNLVKINIFSAPVNHIINDGDTHCREILYIMETSRQAMNIVAHKAARFPVDFAMMQLGVKISMQQPLDSTRSFTFHVRPDKGENFGKFWLFKPELKMFDENGGHGATCTILAQVSEPYYYKSLRQE